MSIFGQVWLWSLLAFIVGALLTWLVLVLPARKRIRELEATLTAVHAERASARQEPAAEQPATLVETPAVERQPWEPQAVAQQDQWQPEDEPELTRQLDSQELTRQLEPEPRLWEPEPVAQEQWEPEPVAQVAEAWEPEQESEPEQEAWEPERTEVRSVLEEQPPTEYMHISEADDEPEGSLFQKPSAPEPDWFDREPLPERSAFEEAPRFGGIEPADETTAFDSVESGELPVEPEETAMETTQLLPKRQRGESIRGGFEPPRPIQPSMRAVERREPSSSETTGIHSGSLFEPTVQPNHVAPEPPPARHQAVDQSVPPGPFGPGSAMPRPGGAPPSEDFAVKASVTALRYCTDESPQFPRMVAEVWFRTAADAERVGFRPLT
ncbi:hypothetical protein SAMN05421504_10695 [Amycolatopsis xylanica]|uniref:Uncharacterized protein n=1 Tax=Amycolatopsis xylanica TaxID=589385 RepID=A0A1H3L775_9PSEU|nr:hypothetical protein [Amycolatopsis xylanica]SDY60263.1 hypothetical protein SAMN05421504_10695 [Amycolatopsis xylanica]